MICESISTKVRINRKLLRDTLDVCEGLIRKVLNKNNKYDHSNLKYNASYISLEASNIKSIKTRAETLKLTHREHAIPLKILIEILEKKNDLTVSSLYDFLEKNLISVLITKEECEKLDFGEFNLKSSMPENWDFNNKFARFEALNIEVKKSDT